MPIVHVTEPCPRCHSTKTGRIIYDTGKSSMKLKTDAFEKGELLQIDPFGYGDTCFCANCGGTWYGTSKIKWMNNASIAIRKKMLSDVNYRNVEKGTGDVSNVSKGKHRRKLIKTVKSLGRVALFWVRAFITPIVKIIWDISPKKDNKTN